MKNNLIIVSAKELVSFLGLKSTRIHESCKSIQDWSLITGDGKGIEVTVEYMYSRFLDFLFVKTSAPRKKFPLYITKNVFSNLAFTKK